MKTRQWMSALTIALAAGVIAHTGTALGGEARRVGCRVELDREVLPAGDAQKAVVKVTLEAPPPPAQRERPPVNLAIVLDRSGSMGGQKLEHAKEAAIEALRRLGPRDRFALVMYDHNVETLVPAQSAANTEWIEGRIRGIRSGGNTALFGGVSQGAAEVRKHLDGDYVHRIILLSDGLANVGPSEPSDLERLGRALMKERISVSTVGVGTDYNEDLMTRLSGSSDGNAYFVETSRDLRRIFAAELGDVLSVVARKVILEIEFPRGTRPVRIIGRDGRVSDGRVEIEMNQLYGGQEKYALVEIEVAGGRPEDERAVAEARCVYENVFTHDEEVATGVARARFSERQEDVVQSVNRSVQQEVLYNYIAEAKDDAVELVDKGQQQQAAQNLRELNEQLRQTAEEYQLGAAVQQQLEMLDADAENIENEGLSKAGRKSFRTDSYQIRNQQTNP